MIFSNNDLLLSRRSQSAFVEQVLTPQTASVVSFDANFNPVSVPSSSLKVAYAEQALSASYAQNANSIEQNLVTVANGSGGTINKGQVVRIIGSTLSDRVVVDLAVAMTHELGSEIISDILGVAYENISAGSDGKILTAGYIGGLNVGGGFTDGDILYVSSTISGSFTNIRPHPPKDLVKVGYVTKVDNVSGAIFVNTRQPVTLDEISNISSSAAPKNGAFLVYNAAEGVWEDKSSGLVLSGSLSASNADVGSLMAGTAVVEDHFSTLNGTVNNNLDVLNDVIVGRNVEVEGQLIASGSAAPFKVVSKVDGTAVFYVTGSRVGINNKMDPDFNLEVNGSFAASTKSFVIDHQELPGKRLVHATLEGPEHAVFQNIGLG
jgi:hypothetical protein